MRNGPSNLGFWGQVILIDQLMELVQNNQLEQLEEEWMNSEVGRDSNMPQSNNVSGGSQPQPTDASALGNLLTHSLNRRNCVWYLR